MQSMDRFILSVIMMTIIITTSAKNYSTVELNRLRITKLYRNHILTRPFMKNSTQTTVAIGLGIIEVSGIDPQQQVCTNDNLII